MNSDFKRTLVTAALPYANGPVHIGHLAGCYLPADIYVRYLRSAGKDVKFVCGSDEHGVPITIRARIEGTTPQAVVDKYHKLMGDAFKDFGISFDIYSRTSSKVHHQTASDFFKKLYDKKVFTEKTTEQYFDESAQLFLADRLIVGTCPRCANPNAYGDQCEKCGTSLSPDELIEPKSTLSGSKPVLKPTKNWFLPLDKLQPKIKAYLDQHSDWRPTVYGQCKSWLDSGDGLQPRAMTRDIDWGVPVPVEGAQGKVLYVWFDAPIGYISATKELLPDSWEDYWKSKESRLIHFIGKDNIVFHCIIFPAMLMEHGDFILPDNVPANEFLNLEGDKISTSRNWAVWLHEYLTDFKDKQDVLRYTLCANAPETRDNDFTWKDFQARNNSELVNIFGNFINRTLVLTHKFYEGKVPEATDYTKEDLIVLQELTAAPDRIAASIEQFRFREAVTEWMNVSRMGNKYLADNAPWNLIKTNAERVKTIMNVALQISCNLAILAEPFLPFTSKKLFGLLNLHEMKWSSAKNASNMATGHAINKDELLFSKVEDSDIQVQLDRLEKIKKENERLAALKEASTETPLKEIKEATSFDDFLKMDIRTATILEAESIPKTNKLLKLKLDTGVDQRTVVSGIALYYKPEEIIGKQVCLLANLAPRKIMGIESQGMILMAENSKGELCFVSPVNNGFQNGSLVK
ncbi:MAG: methionine--tRNA ligase [Bacteroidia bacterium]|nr:methionine--tRNA ligase [Bacteroidia bacterium]